MDISQPLELHREVVRPEYIDWNGHMNMAYYVLVFDHATDEFYDFLGLDSEHREQGGFSTFTLECNVAYHREVKEGDLVRVTTQFLDYSDKLLHYFHHMYHVQEGYLAATNELLGCHIDMRRRRSASFPDRILRRIGDIHTAHAALPLPTGAGRRIGIRRTSARAGEEAGADA